MKEQTLPRPSPAAIGADVWRVRNRGFGSNTYICRLRQQERCFVVDPGLDLEAIEFAIDSLSVTPVAIFCTHGHFDHLGCASELQSRYELPVYLHPDDVKVAKLASFTMRLAGVKGRVTVPMIDTLAQDDAEFFSGSDLVKFIHTPGHTPGSCCISFGDYVFTGDTLYRDSVDLSAFPGVDRDQLQISLAKIWNAWPDASLICPGHGPEGAFSNVKRDNSDFRSLCGLDDVCVGG